MERRILAAIVWLTQEKGFPPTVREIGHAVGLRSSSSVQHYLDDLSAKGYITRVPGRNRTIRVTSYPPIVKIPHTSSIPVRVIFSGARGSRPK